MPPWRTMCRSEDLRASDLWDERAGKYVDVVVVFRGVRMEEKAGDGGQKKALPTAYFAKHPFMPDKPLRMNPTNCLQVQQLFGTDITDEWVGRAITLCVMKVKSPKNGMVDGIRVVPKLPEQPARTGNAPSSEEQRAIAERERKENARG